MRTMTTISAIKQRKDDKEVIDQLLGNKKFLRLPLDFIKVMSVDEAVFVTYLLDKTKYFFNLPLPFDGIVLYRVDLEDRFGWSQHTQRKIESKLKDKEILEVTLTTKDKISLNKYQINIEKLLEMLCI